MPTLHVQIEGRVQGVGFRWFVRQCAKRKSIGGWVANRADGTVEVAAKGAESELKRFRRELQVGPAGAEVIAIKDMDPLSDADLSDSFEVKR